MRRVLLTVVCLGMFLLVDCATLKVGTEKDSSVVDVEGLANGYASVNGIRPYDGTILELGVFHDSSKSQQFEVVALDLWPVVGFGVGLAGARVQLLFLDMGIGVLSYNPKPPTPGPEVEDEGEDDVQATGEQLQGRKGQQEAVDDP